MSLGVGIVGLPNVGKTTLFNALTRAGAGVASYAFSTVEPNTAMVEVPDKRLEVQSFEGLLAEFAQNPETLLTWNLALWTSGEEYRRRGRIAQSADVLRLALPYASSSPARMNRQSQPPAA